MDCSVPPPLPSVENRGQGVPQGMPPVTTNRLHARILGWEWPGPGFLGLGEGGGCVKKSHPMFSPDVEASMENRHLLPAIPSQGWRGGLFVFF